MELNKLLKTENNFSTLVELLRYRAVHQPNQTAYTFLVDGETKEVSITYQQLDKVAQVIAAKLQLMGAAGSQALLLYPPGLEFIEAFFGCLYAQVVAVPVYPPRPNHSLSRLQGIVADAQPVIALTTTGVLSGKIDTYSKFFDVNTLGWLTTDNLGNLEQEWQEPVLTSDTVAFLQYTSGSTGTPKGVILSHGNLLHNSALIHQCFEHTANSQGVIWLPPYHDMGLIGGVLQPLYGGFCVTLMSPVDFLQSPVRWLNAISRYKATTSGGPNFAYDLCLRKITPEQRANLDLSSWEVAFNGAEPVRIETIERFSEIFASCGFRREAFYPCYGMAETTLIVSGGLKTQQPKLKTVRADALEENLVVESDKAKELNRTLVSCGKARLNQQIAIVHPQTFSYCSSNQVGEI